MRKSEARDEGGVPDWVVTFADLMTLLFCFFVLLTTLSTQPKNCSGIQSYLDQNRQNFKKFELRSSKLECILSLPSDFLFKSGSDELQRRALTNLVPLFRAIKEMDEHKKDQIIVEGHTDDVPIKTRRFPSNWELSSSRATNMVSFLVNRLQFNEKRISTSAYAASLPKVDYVQFGKKIQGSELRTARGINRRVEIVFIKKPDTRLSMSLLFDGI